MREELVTLDMLRMASTVSAREKKKKLVTVSLMMRDVIYASITFQVLEKKDGKSPAESICP